MLGMLGGIGAPEILVVLIVVSLIFGASRLPEIGANLGKGIKNFKKSIMDAEDEVNKSLEEGGDKE